MRFILYGEVDDATREALQHQAVHGIFADISSGKEHLSEEYPQAVLRSLEECRLLVRESSRYSFGSRIIYPDEAVEGRLLDAASVSSKRYANLVSEHVIAIRDTLTSAYPEVMDEFGWNYLSLVVVGGFLVDLAVGSTLYGGRLQRKSCWIICYNENADPGSQVGVRAVATPSGDARLGLFWVLAHNNAGVYFSMGDAQLIRDLSFEPDSAISKGMQTRLLRLLYLKALKRDGVRYRPNIPVFVVSRFSGVEKYLKSVARRVVDEVIVPDLARMSNLSAEFAQGEDGFPGKLLYNRLLMEATFLRLAQTGAVGAPNASRGDCWGSWMWLNDVAEDYPFLL